MVYSFLFKGLKIDTFTKRLQKVKYFITLISFILIVINTITAQQIEVSPKIKLTNKIPRFELLGKNNYGYIVRRFGGPTQAIDIFDEKLNLVKTNEIKLSGVEVIDVILIPEGAWMVYLDPIRNYTFLKAVRLDKELKITKKEVIIDSIPEKGEHLAINFKSASSIDKRFHLFYMPLYKDGDLTGFKTVSVNNKMQVVNNQNLKFDLISGFDFSSAGISRTGGALMIFKNKQKAKNPSPSIVKVFYSENGEKFKDIEMNLGYKLYHSPRFAIDHLNDKLLFAGFYQSDLKNKKSGAGGLLTGSLDFRTGKIISKKRAFEKSLIEELTGEEDRKEGLDLYTFYISKVIPKVDGGMAVITESFYKNQDDVFTPSVFSYSSFSNYRSVNVFFYNDLIVFDFDSLFSLTDEIILRKKQVSEEDNGRYSSFFAVNTRDKLRLLYLDEISRAGNFSEYVFDDRSDFEINSLFNSGQKDIMPIARLAVQTALDEVVVPGYKSNTYRLIKLTY